MATPWQMTSSSELSFPCTAKSSPCRSTVGPALLASRTELKLGGKLVSLLWRYMPALAASFSRHGDARGRDSAVQPWLYSRVVFLAATGVCGL